MTRHRSSLVVALLALGVTSLAFAQTPPPESTDMPPADTTQTDTSSQPPAAQSASQEGKAMQDQKLQDCISTEEAKNSALSDTQVKQKCMLEIGSHQGH